MKFNDLQKGKIYQDKDGVKAFMFVEIRNSSLATFNACKYNEEKGNFISTKEIIYLTANEVKNLI